MKNLDQFSVAGYTMVPRVLSFADCERLLALITPIHATASGGRTLLAETWCRDAAESLRAHPLLGKIIPSGSVAIQCTYFQKSAVRNWLVPIHQDLSIPVARRVDGVELTGWSEKGGIQYVQAPAGLLEEMVAVRLHLDPCGVYDGPLRLIPGSHVFGRMTNEHALELKQTTREVSCVAEAGAALVMRPLILHASSKSTGSSRRRVLHFLFAPKSPPLGLKWRDSV